MTFFFAAITWIALWPAIIMARAACPPTTPPLAHPPAARSAHGANTLVRKRRSCHMLLALPQQRKQRAERALLCLASFVFGCS